MTMSLLLIILSAIFENVCMSAITLKLALYV